MESLANSLDRVLCAKNGFDLANTVNGFRSAVNRFVTPSIRANRKIPTQMFAQLLWHSVAGAAASIFTSTWEHKFLAHHLLGL